VATWVRHLWRDRQDVASVGQAYGCAAIILVGMFVAKLVVVQTPETFADLARLIVVPQLGLLLAPALLMACVLTRSLRCSLNFHWPPWPTLPAAVLLGVCLHPSYTTLGHFIQRIYPLSPETVEAFAPFERLVNAAPLTAVILVLAVIPAICEEIAFRGFIFNGLRQKGAGARAVLVTAVLFGMSHGMLQQSLAATLMGLLLGWITLRSGSLLPALVVHAINNTLSVGLGRADQLRGAWAEYVFDFTAETTRYSVAWTLIAAGVAISCLLYFSMLPPPVRPEDDPQTAFAGDLAPATAV
jgi:sodium transport system permease protein